MLDKAGLANRWAALLVWTGLCTLFFCKQLATLLTYALHHDNASHTLLVPLIAGWLLYTDRHKIVPNPLDLSAGYWFAVAALATLAARGFLTDIAPRLAASILAFILFFVAGFVALFGRKSAKAVRFPLMFLLFMIPMPEIFLNRAIYLLQAGSAAVAQTVFDLAGVPVLREGFVFHLSGLNIEVAKECSGIRSSIALLILATLVAHFAFRKTWKKLVFVSVGLILMAVKNGARIATLTILAKYVDPGFLFGRLHHQGGVVFFLLGLALLVPVYWLLQRGETGAPSLRKDSTQRLHAN